MIARYSALAAKRSARPLAALCLAATLPAAGWRLHDLAGKQWSPADLTANRASVFLFLDAGCPLSRRFLPILRDLHDAYAQRGIGFFAVAATREPIGIPFPVLHDPNLTLARQWGARVTPEAVVATERGEVLYRGRIDDRATALGSVREPTRHDLRMALDAILAGGKPHPREFRAIGCALPIAPATRRTSPAFHADVAPLLYRHCTVCHGQGGAAPFPLTTYDEASPRAAAIAEVTARRLMPPWKPSPGPPHFAGERRLTAREIRIFEDWSRAGAPEGPGPPPERPPAPTPPPSATNCAEPCAVLTMNESVPIPAGGPDQYLCVVVPANAPHERFVSGFEFKPGNPRILHHALIFTDRSGTARKLDREHPGPGYPCFGVPGFLPSSSLGGWTPGAGPVTYPPGTATRIPAGADLVLQLHYHPVGVPAEDRSQLVLRFTPNPPTRRMMDVALGSRNIDIPAGEAAYRVRDHFTLPVPVEVTGIIPHAHYVCREMRGWAILPSGRRMNLITIRDWDFNWQQHYRYAKPFRLPEGTRVEMEFVYDNSDGNPRNPSRPPRRVTWGPDSADEMAGLHLQVIPDNDDDARELGQSLWGKIMRDLGGGIYRPLTLE